MLRRKGLTGEYFLTKKFTVYGLCGVILLSVSMYSILLLASDSVYVKSLIETKPFDESLYEVIMETSMEYAERKDKDDRERIDGTRDVVIDDDDDDDNDDDDALNKTITTTTARRIDENDDNDGYNDADDNDGRDDDDDDSVAEIRPTDDGTKPDKLPSTNLYLTVVSKGQLGNQMFQYAALYCLTQTNHAWKPYLQGKKSYRHIMKTFGKRLSIGQLPFSPTEQRLINLWPKSNADSLLRALSRLPTDRNVTIKGYFQSYKFFERCKDDIREQFSVPEAWRRSILKYLDELTMAVVGNLTYTRVGVHVRRTSMVIEEKLALGYVPPPPSYYQHAIEYFMKSYHRVVFVVASDDLSWCRQHLSAEYMVFVGGSMANDLLTLSLCDHLITSLGTYSWWAGWLNSGTTVYYGVLPTPDSYAGQLYANHSYIPPDDQYNKWLAIV